MQVSFQNKNKEEKLLNMVQTLRFVSVVHMAVEAYALTNSRQVYLYRPMYYGITERL